MKEGRNGTSLSDSNSLPITINRGQLEILEKTGITTSASPVTWVDLEIIEQSLSKLLLEIQDALKKQIKLCQDLVGMVYAKVTDKVQIDQPHT
jgi:hypothetical protein